MRSTRHLDSHRGWTMSPSFCAATTACTNAWGWAVGNRRIGGGQGSLTSTQCQVRELWLRINTTRFPHFVPVVSRCFSTAISAVLPLLHGYSSPLSTVPIKITTKYIN